MYIVYRSMWAYTYCPTAPNSILGMATTMYSAHCIQWQYKDCQPVVIWRD